ncbi:UNVERIFIED_CONTAM: hypothetical protein PYX00_007190 [Menopon gallinae]|uniref:ATP synthase mitochondrial F1 complex assembly factor 1 n=1 Tax=Menopon gallinae TaxID=328185 RepID=A0AAW2HI12_9NEOP
MSNISTTSASLDKMLDELRTNPYYEKYADKIANLQQISPEELKEKMENLQKKKKPVKVEMKERPYSSAPAEGKPQLHETQHVNRKRLDDVMKTELLRDKSADEIKDIWLDYHKTKDGIAGVVPKEVYKIMEERGREFSTFLLPVPRSQGYEFIMCQFLGNEVHFTPLIAYQTHKENAPECLTMTFYTDLIEEKSIVLMKGEYDSNILNCQEAQCLANELQLYYSQNSERRINLLKKFTYSPNEFNHMDLIAELETLSL